MVQSLFSQVVVWVIGIISDMGYGGVAVCMAIESCNIPLPSEVIQPFAGYLVSIGRFSFVPAVLAGTIGGTAGSVVSYYLGYYMMDSPALFWIAREKREGFVRWFQTHGEKAAFWGRMLPVVRTFISLPAGYARMNLWRFIAYTFMGSLLWSLFLTYAGYVLGKNWEVLIAYFHRADLAVFVLFIVAIAWIYGKRKGWLKF